MSKCIFYVLLLILFSCSTSKINKVNKPSRSFSALLELDVNEISNNTFDERKEEFRGNADQRIEEFDGYDQILSESIGEIEVDALQDLSHVSEPITQALVFCHQGAISNGIKILNSIYSKYSKEARYYNSLGVCYFKMQNLRKAKYYFDYSVSLKKYSPALNNLAIMYYQSGDFQKSYLLFNDAVRGSKHNSSRFNLALLLYSKGLYEKSIATLKTIQQTNKNITQISDLLGACYLMLGNLSAFEALEKERGRKRTFFNDLNNALYLALKKNLTESNKILDGIKPKNSYQKSTLINYQANINKVSE